MSRAYACYPLGDSALVVKLGEAIEPELLPVIRDVAEFLERHRFPGFIEVVPAYTTITVYYDVLVVAEQMAEAEATAGKFDRVSSPYGQVAQTVQHLLDCFEAASSSSATAVEPRIVHIPVRYGGEFGPDLAELAASHDLTEEEVVALHTARDYPVYMIGFAPGFPYLGGLDARLTTPRRAVPRTGIPAGSVAIGGAQTGIYPLVTPGGWHVIGRTPLALFRPDQEPPSLLQAGDMVRFVPIGLHEDGTVGEGAG